MATRPTSISVIGWFMIVSGLLSCANEFARSIRPGTLEIMATGTLPIPVQHGISFVDSTASVVYGYFLLQGKNWARYLYVICTTIQFSYVFMASPVKLPAVPGVFIFLVISYFLFCSRARAFFSANQVNVVASKTTLRHILSISCYIAAGLLLSSICLLAFSSTPDHVAKLAILGVMSVPPFVLLLSGRAASDNPRWEREIGIVLVASAIVGAMMALTVVLMFMDPGYRKAIPLEKQAPFRDYGTGLLWIAVIGVLGGAALLKGRGRPNIGRT